EQARRSLWVGGRRAFRCLVGTGPEHTEVVFNPLVGHSGIIRNSASRGCAKLLEYFPGVVERKTLRSIEGFRNVLNDLPVGLRIARRFDGLVDSNDASLDLGHRPFVLFLQGA